MLNTKTAFFQITDRELCILWVKPHRIFRKKVTGFEIERIPIPTGVVRQGQLIQQEILSSLLKDKFDQAKVAARIPAYLVLTQRQGYCRTFTLPWISVQSRSKALQFLLAEEFSLGEQEMMFDYIVADEKREDNILQLLTGVSRTSMVVPFVQTLDAAGFTMKGVYYGAAVAGPALNLQPEEDTLYIDMDGTIPQLILWQGLYPKAIRVPMIDPALPMQLEEWTSEVHRLLLYADSQQSGLNLQRIYICGNRSAEVSQNLGLGENCLWIEALLSQKLQDQAEAFQGDASSGLFLWGAYELCHAGRTTLNLFARDLKRHRQLRLAKAAIAVFLGVNLIAGSAMGVVWRESRTLEEEIAQTREQAEKMAAITKVDQEITTQWRQALQHPYYVASNLQSMESIQSPSINYDQVQYKEGALLLQGTSENANEVEKLIEGLAVLGWQRPVLTGYKLGLGGKIEFTVNAMQPGGKK